MKVKFLSFKRLKLHEVHTTIRMMQKDPVSWPQRSKIYSHIQGRAIKSFLTQLGPVILAYLAIASLKNENEISLKIGSIEASLPAAYFLFATSLAYLVASLTFNQLSAAVSLKSSLAGKMLLHGFSINAYQVIDENDDTGLGIPMAMDSFFKEVLPISSCLSFLLLFSLFAFLVPLGALGVFLLSEQYQLAASPSIEPEQRVSAVFGIVVVSTAFLSVFFYHIPVPHSKNTSRIRWSFLYSLEPHHSDAEKFSRWKKSE